MSKNYNVRIIAKTSDAKKTPVTTNTSSFFKNSNNLALVKHFGCREAFCSDLNLIQNKFTLLERYYLDISTGSAAKYDDRIESKIFRSGIHNGGNFYLGRSDDGEYLRFDFRYRNIYTLSLGLWCMLFSPTISKRYFEETIDFFLKPHSSFDMPVSDRIGSAFYYEFCIKQGRNLGITTHIESYIGPGHLVSSKIFSMFPHFSNFLQTHKKKIAKLYLQKISSYHNQYQYDLYFFMFCNKFDVNLSRARGDLEKILLED